MLNCAPVSTTTVRFAIGFGVGDDQAPVLASAIDDDRPRFPTEIGLDDGTIVMMLVPKSSWTRCERNRSTPDDSVGAHVLTIEDHGIDTLLPIPGQPRHPEHWRSILPIPRSRCEAVSRRRWQAEVCSRSDGRSPSGRRRYPLGSDRALPGNAHRYGQPVILLIMEFYVLRLTRPCRPAKRPTRPPALAVTG